VCMCVYFVLIQAHDRNFTVYLKKKTRKEKSPFTKKYFFAFEGKLVIII
jgi:hypothetical protein